MRAGRAVVAALAALVGLAAIGLIIGGGALLWAHGTQRDADGYVTSEPRQLVSDGYAITSPEVDIAAQPGAWWPSDLVDIKLEVTPEESVPVFVGIGRSDDVRAYLAGVAHDEVTALEGRDTAIEYRSVAGTVAATPPTDETFWDVVATGRDTQALTWDVAQGEWTVVIMNADARPDVTADVEAGVRIPAMLGVGIGMVIAGLVIGALAAAALVWAVHEVRASDEAAPLGVPTASPVTVEGHLDSELSRWMWLVKWLLALPHYIALAFLWAAFVLLTVVAFFAIVFTGRYPRSIFDFNVGVLRWTWRVSFYSSSALATDQYPPFTLRDVDYPARLDVAYPHELSRGLALIKWWLLAIPHYLIVGVFTSGLIWWAGDTGNGDAVLEIGGGLIGLLAIIAGFALLFTGRYPRGLFDLVMGLNRWVYRVVAYAALMRDEYPPFRLDTGGEEPMADDAEPPSGPSDLGTEAELPIGSG